MIKWCSTSTDYILIIWVIHATVLFRNNATVSFMKVPGTALLRLEIIVIIVWLETTAAFVPATFNALYLPLLTVLLLHLLVFIFVYLIFDELLALSETIAAGLGVETTAVIVGLISRGVNYFIYYLGEFLGLVTHLVIQDHSCLRLIVVIY